MTIQRMASNAWIVSHSGQSCTFLRFDFIAMVLWARNMQTLSAVGV